MEEYPLMKRLSDEMAALFPVFNRVVMGVCEGQSYDMVYETRNDVTVEAYGYDYEGNRVSKATGGAYTRYVIDTNRELAQVLAEVDAAGNETAANRVVTVTIGGLDCKSSSLSGASSSIASCISTDTNSTL